MGGKPPVSFIDPGIECDSCPLSSCDLPINKITIPLASMDSKKILDQIADASEQYKAYQRICFACYTTVLRMFYLLLILPNEEIKRLISLLDIKHWVSNTSLPHHSLVQQGNYLKASSFLPEASLLDTREKCKGDNK